MCVYIFTIFFTFPQINLKSGTNALNFIIHFKKRKKYKYSSFWKKKLNCEIWKRGDKNVKYEPISLQLGPVQFGSKSSNRIILPAARGSHVQQETSGGKKKKKKRKEEEAAKQEEDSTSSSARRRWTRTRLWSWWGGASRCSSSTFLSTRSSASTPRSRIARSRTDWIPYRNAPIAFPFGSELSRWSYAVEMAAICWVCHVSAVSAANFCWFCEICRCFLLGLLSRGLRWFLPVFISSTTAPRAGRFMRTLLSIVRYVGSAVMVVSCWFRFVCFIEQCHPVGIVWWVWK